MTNPNDIADAYKRYAEAEAQANTLNKTALFANLAATEITLVNAEFDGEGDSGQINEITAHKGTTVVPLPALSVTLQRASWGSGELKPEQTTLREAIETLCYGYLSQEHGGWENDDGGFGEFTFHVAEARIDLDFNSRYTDSALFTHSF
jgi:hypothetical protein